MTDDDVVTVVMVLRVPRRETPGVRTSLGMVGSRMVREGRIESYDLSHTIPRRTPLGPRAHRPPPLDEVMSGHAGLALEAARRLLAAQPNVEVRMIQVREAYVALCNERGQSPRRYTQFWTYIQWLGAHGLLDVWVNEAGDGYTGRTTLVALPAPEASA